jgi:hypothetical protein
VNIAPLSPAICFGAVSEFTAPAERPDPLAEERERHEEDHRRLRRT